LGVLATGLLVYAAPLGARGAGGRSVPARAAVRHRAGDRVIPRYDQERLAEWRQDIGSAVSAALVVLPQNLTHGIIAFSPLGPEGLGAGAFSVVAGAAIAGMVATRLSSSPSLASGLNAALSLTLGVVIATLVGLGVIPKGAAGIGPAILVSMAVALLAGLCMALFALVGVMRYVGLIPYPVTAGIVNGTALLLVLNQGPRALGLEYGDGWQDLLDHPLAPVIAIITGAVLLRPPRLSRVLTAGFFAVLVGAALQQALLALGAGSLLGPLLGPVPSVFTQGHSVLAAYGSIDLLLQPHVFLLLASAAVTLSVICTIETAATSAALGDITGRTEDAGRNLGAIALGNVAGAFFGGFITSGSIGASLSLFRQGGRTRRTALLRAAAMLLVVVTSGPLLALLPQAALAAVVLIGAVKLLDADSLRLLRAATVRGARNKRDLIGNALVVLAVAGTALAYNLILAVGVGILLSLVVFVVTMAGTPVRRVYRQPVGRSRIRHPPAAEAILVAHGEEIAVIELEGTIFFGSAQLIGEAVQKEFAAGAKEVILDLRRVGRIDLSGARRLLATCGRCWRDGQLLTLAPVRPGQPLADYLSDLALDPLPRPEHVHQTLDGAVAAAEARLIARHASVGVGAEAEPLEVLQGLGLTAAGAATLLSHMTEERFEAGQTVIRTGERSDSVRILIGGTADVCLPPEPGSPPFKLATFSPGTIFGEMALLTGAPRSADVIAAAPLRCLRLDLPAVDAMRQSDPDAAFALMKAIALQLERNLRWANLTLATLEP